LVHPSKQCPRHKQKQKKRKVKKMKKSLTRGAEGAKKTDF